MLGARTQAQSPLETRVEDGTCHGGRAVFEGLYARAIGWVKVVFGVGFSTAEHIKQWANARKTKFEK